MKFLCLPCDHVMDFADRSVPGDGTMAAVFACSSCGNEIAMLANPMETQLVSSLGVKVGGREVPGQPMELTRSKLADGRDDAFTDDDAAPDATAPADPEDSPTGPGPDAATASDQPRAMTATGPPAGRVVWSEDAVDRLSNVPSFVRGMVKRIYTDYAQQHGIQEITPETMDRARTDLGLEGM